MGSRSKVHLDGFFPPTMGLVINLSGWTSSHHLNYQKLLVHRSLKRLQINRQINIHLRFIENTPQQNLSL